MSRTITIEIPIESEPLVRKLLALHEELHALALSAPDGTVLEACEMAVIDKGRDLHTALLTEAVAQRIESVEKKGPRSATVRAAARKKIVASPSANSSPRSAFSG